jgi:hypothetical protein
MLSVDNLKIIKSIFINISAVDAELFHAGRQEDGQDEANSCFSHSAKSRKNKLALENLC